MPSGADLNERQRQYMQAIYETDQEQEAEEYGYSFRISGGRGRVGMKVKFL